MFYGVTYDTGDAAHGIPRFELKAAGHSYCHVKMDHNFKTVLHYSTKTSEVINATWLCGIILFLYATFKLHQSVYCGMCMYSILIVP